jgi:hypothetical protein
MALSGPERIPLMNIVRLRSHALIPGVIGALLVSFALSFAFAGTAAAAPRTCVFTATSSAGIRVITGDISGSLTEIDATVTKYTNGCGYEYGSLTVTEANNFLSANATVSAGSAQNSEPYLPYYPYALTTPTILGNSPACGTISFQGYYGGSGQGSACTPS